MKGTVQIAHVHIETRLILSEEYVQVLIVENPSEFYRFVSDLNVQFDGGKGDFSFSRNGEPIDAVKYGAMISDAFHFDLNDKKILSLLHKKMESLSFGEKLVAFNGVSAKISEYLGELAFLVPFALDYDEVQPLDLFKAAGVKFEKNYDSLEEKIICYINALIELKRCEFFVFVNIKSVLSDEKLLQIYEHCKREQVGVFLVEDSKRRNLLFCEKAVLITDDLCEIVENYE